MNRLAIVGLVAGLATATGCELGRISALPARDAGPEGSSPDPTPALRFKILTGPAKGNYVRAAAELQTFLGEGIELASVPTRGSYANIDQLGRGRGDLAFAQFDAIAAFASMGPAQKAVADACRVVAPLQLETVHVLVEAGGKMTNWSMLEGAVVAMGPLHSGSWISAWNLMNHLTGGDFDLRRRGKTMSYSEGAAALLRGKVDAMIVTAAPGIPLLRDLGPEAVAGVRLLALPEEFARDRTVAWSYEVTSIPGGVYGFAPAPTRALATRSYLLASEDVPPEQIQPLAASLFGRAEELARGSTLWRLLDREAVREEIRRGIPYHEGVVRALGM